MKYCCLNCSHEYELDCHATAPILPCLLVWFMLFQLRIMEDAVFDSFTL